MPYFVRIHTEKYLIFSCLSVQSQDFLQLYSVIHSMNSSNFTFMEFFSPEFFTFPLSLADSTQALRTSILKCGDVLDMWD